MTASRHRPLVHAIRHPFCFEGGEHQVYDILASPIGL
jgi:hypothetical protein